MRKFLRPFFSLPLIQEGLLSDTSESKCWLSAELSLPRKKSVVRSTDCPEMTIAVDWDFKHQSKQTNKATEDN